MAENPTPNQSHPQPIAAEIAARLATRMADLKIPPQNPLYLGPALPPNAAEAAPDALIANLSLTWEEDLPATLLGYKNTLKPDSPLLITLLGSETTLPHPFPTVQQAGDLLVRLGLALPVVDTETLTITFPSAQRAAQHLQQESFPSHITPQGTSISLHILYLHAFTPGPGQPQGKPRGSGKVSLVRILNNTQ